MRLYQRRDGSIAGTQADAGKGFKQIDVPTDKPGLIAFLNGRPTETTERLPAPAVVGQESAPATSETVECSRCKWGLKARQRYSDEVERSMTIDGLCQKIDKAEGGALEQLVTAVTVRLTDVAAAVR